LPIQIKLSETDNKKQLLDSFNFLSNELSKIAKTNVDMNPVNLEEFLYSEDYMKLPKLSQVQLDFLKYADDDDPNTNELLEFILVWGKGGGKDWLTSIFFSRRGYKLLCRANPQAFFGLPEGEPIDFLNVAVSADQAKDVFFNKLTNMIKLAGPLAFKQFGFDPDKDILDSKIIFPKNIRLFSGHSEMDSMEGKNLYAAVMDEASAFKTEAELRGKGPRAKRSATAIYKFLSSSIRSRFPKVGKLVLISYPRFKDDFILQRYEAGKKDPQTYTSFGATWQINPLRTQVDFDKDYRDNPEQARSMYECIPPNADDPFIREQEKILKIIDSTAKPPYDIWGNYYPDFRGKPFKYTIGLDLSLSGDRTGFSMCHREHKNGKEIVVIDLLKVWEAEKGKEIDLDSIYKEILFLRSRGFNISGIYRDQFQSALMAQLLQKENFYVESISIESKLEHWNSLKALIYNEELKVYKSENSDLLIDELQGLSLINGIKVDHKGNLSTKDLTDSLVRAIYGITSSNSSGEFIFKLA
jgi:hypothetical protein